MMKNLIKIVFVLGLVVFSAQGCTDLLDNPAPSDELTTEVVLNNPETINAVRFDMYTYLQSEDYTTLYMLGPSAIADDFVNLIGTSRYEGLTQNQFGDGLGTDGVYANTYGLINQANTIISGIPEGVITDQEYLNRIQGEAYFFRAFAMHHAVRVYGYEPGATPNAGQGAGFELGIIIRTEPTFDISDADFRARSTVTEVYTQIKADLNAAIGLLPLTGEIGEAGIYFINRAAAQALLARVLLYERSYGEAATIAQNAIDNSGARMATPAEVATMFNETVGANPETIFAMQIDPLTASQGSESVSGYTATFWNAMIPSKEVLSVYASADARNAWFAPCFSTNKDDCTGDYLGDPGFVAQELQKWNGDKGQLADDIPFFRISELKLIQAEAYALAAGSVTQQAVDALNDVRVNRNLAPVTIADFASGGTDAFVDSVLLERRREFIGEGHRWFDLKRLQRDIPKPAVTPTAPEIPFTSIRVLDNIPNEELEVNPELVQNPGY